MRDYFYRKSYRRAIHSLPTAKGQIDVLVGMCDWVQNGMHQALGDSVAQDVLDGIIKTVKYDDAFRAKYGFFPRETD
jgi:hypothetical protein